jgi:indolepyruvate decarboxylase
LLTRSSFEDGKTTNRSYAMADGVSIGDYIIDRLNDHGVRHVFGIPGDYVIGFFNKIAKSPLELIITSDEQGAGFAADAYARMNGLGVACVTFSVGGLKLANTTAQAFAEKSPVLVISGAPGQQERMKNPVLHHKVNFFSDQLRVFEHLTIASSVLSDQETAFSEIDRVIDSVLLHKQPGYLELPRDMLSLIPENQRCRKTTPSAVRTDPATLREALNESVGMINQAEKPVILAGVGVERHNLLDQVLMLARKGGIPITATILGKTAVPEEDPLYMGIYGGIVGNEIVTEYVESSDCIIMVGAYLSDLDIGSLTSHLEQGSVIHITADKVTLRHHIYPGLGFNLLTELSGADLRLHDPSHIPFAARRVPPVVLDPEAPITTESTFATITSFLKESNILIPDVGDALFGTAEITLPCLFMSTAYYASMGFGVPAAIGVQLACPDKRPFVITGDGAFQMTGMELSTAVRYDLNPVVIVLNNQGYGTLRIIQEGTFDDISPWEYNKIPEVIGAGKGFLVKTVGELRDALDFAKGCKEFCIIEVILERGDVSACLQRLGSAIRKRL